MASLKEIELAYRREFMTKHLLRDLYWTFFVVVLCLVWAVPVLILLGLSLVKRVAPRMFEGSGRVQLDEYVKDYKDAHSGGGLNDQIERAGL